ncbi:MAG: cell division inhibitor SepF [Bacillota bacterium]|jgi:cell division inhibitor SepF|nr:cell division inhibitor SepF [Bacillota bacterium]MDK2881981.1 cell division inhibitor SepF [Bacillota bacterium]MDK2960065.1 cell division inhibitor SepF [Bacillota bacterium]
MAGGLVGKFLNLMGFEEVLEEDASQEEPVLEPVRTYGEHRKGKVVGLPSSSGIGKVVVVQPEGFEAAKTVADHLKSRRTVIVNLEGVDEGTAQRIVDFASGATFALNGTVERVGGEIFLFAPNNVDVVAPRKDEDVALPWLK